MEELRSFRKFLDAGQAIEVAQVLNDHHIITKIIEVGSSLDSNFGGGDLTREIEIQILHTDFAKADEILKNKAENIIPEIENDYYLFSFSNDELYDVLLKPDEWSKLDYNLSKKILIERGEPISESLLKNLHKLRLSDLEKPEESQPAWIYTGYLFSILGGVIGIFIGWHIWTGTKTLPDGRKVSTYNKSDKKQGRNIFFIGIIVFPMVFLFKIFSGL